MNLYLNLCRFCLGLKGVPVGRRRQVADLRPWPSTGIPMSGPDALPNGWSSTTRPSTGVG